MAIFAVEMRQRHDLLDPDRVMLDPDPASKSGRGVRIIGWSPTAQCLVTVIELNHEGTTYGVNGWRSNTSTVYSVRLNLDELQELQALADEAGIPSSTLVRSWILERVRAGGEAPADIRQLIHDEVRDAVRDALKTAS